MDTTFEGICPAITKCFQVVRVPSQDIDQSGLRGLTGQSLFDDAIAVSIPDGGTNLVNTMKAAKHVMGSFLSSDLGE